MAVEFPVPETPPPAESRDATRSARYALITAVVAAVISSVVAAGSAVYVSIDQANHAERQALSQAVRSDREKVYSDYLTSYFELIQELSTSEGNLRITLPREAIATEFQTYATRSVEFYAASSLLLMVGSDEIVEVVDAISTSFLEFARKYADFELHYLAPGAPGANDPTGWTHDSTTLATVIDTVMRKQQNLIGALLTQGHADLGR
ncbi:hypothetical protein [Nocardia sp. alder85J]|uniref:hypothetical protein n=1 Tax=Nocardia sp. alder85J TaxID=2862949 RepID=UPI001CD4E385|nr:hypothetical protein [Nocardia sp. alder85J]MCX4093792.1 hypothetical protein [Nocardia sp. alder85J]